MDSQKFLEEITTNFTDLYIETFTIRYLKNFDAETFEKDFKNSMVILNKKFKNKFKRKIAKLKLEYNK